MALQGLKKLKAIVAMHNDWTKLDSSVVAAWTELNSLSTFSLLQPPTN
jgi:hypothetical protein